MRVGIARTGLALGLGLIVGEVALVTTDRGVLISERRVKPGESYVVEEWGNLGAGSGSLYCRYFTGRAVAGIVYHYSPNGMFGRRACPFLLEPA